MLEGEKSKQNRSQSCPFVKTGSPLEGTQALHKRYELGIFIHVLDEDLITKKKLFLQLTEEF